MSRSEPLHPPIVVLAAGLGTRMPDADKLLVSVLGRPVMQWSLDLARRACPDERPVLVVVPELTSERAEIARAAGAIPVAAPHAGRGMWWSLRAGLAAGGDAGVIIALADDPLALLDLTAVTAAAGEAPQSPCAVRRSSGAPHPVYVPPALITHVLAVDPESHRPDAGLRDLLPSTTRWITDPAATQTIDVDTHGDIDRLTLALARTPHLH